VREEKACAHDKHRRRVVFFRHEKFAWPDWRINQARRPPVTREFGAPTNGGDLEVAFGTRRDGDSACRERPQGKSKGYEQLRLNMSYI
jgi:hypothetical protein